MLTYRSMRAHQVEGRGLRPPMNRQQEALDGGAAPRWLILSRRLLRPSAWTCCSFVPTVTGVDLAPPSNEARRNGFGTLVPTGRVVGVL
jgi:hypothetical protein